MIVKNYREFVKGIKREFIAFDEEKTVIEGQTVLVKNNDYVVIQEREDSVQVYLSFYHEWTAFAFPSYSIMTIVGSSIFYYGELACDEQ